MFKHKESVLNFLVYSCLVASLWNLSLISLFRGCNSEERGEKTFRKGEVFSLWVLDISIPAFCFVPIHYFTEFGFLVQYKMQRGITDKRWHKSHGRVILLIMLLDPLTVFLMQI